MKKLVVTPAFTFSGVTVHSATKVFVIAVLDDLLEKQPDHSLVLRWADGKWTQTPVSETVIGSCIVVEDGPKLINVCSTGYVKVLSSDLSSEDVDRSRDGPNTMATLRAARTIAGKAHAAGLARRVYRRMGPSTWLPIDNGVFAPRKTRTQAVGFLCIDGNSLEEVYAAGLAGEIWHFDGSRWMNQESPSNVALTSMRCSSSGEVYITGLVGTIIHGRAGSWKILKQDITQEDFWGSAIFKGVPYFSTNNAVYRLLGRDLERVKLQDQGRITARHLDCDADVMWSVGSKHLFSTRDGSNWNAIPGPP